MGTGEFIEEMDHESINYFKSGAEIAEFFRTTFPMSETEGDKLAGYMKGHGYLLGCRDGKLYRGDLCCEPDEMYWEAYALYDAVVAVGDWNYELLEEAGIAPEEKGAARQAGGDRYPAELWEDMVILDGLFGRICGKKMKNTIYKEGIYHVQDEI